MPHSKPWISLIRSGSRPEGLHDPRDVSLGRRLFELEHHHVPEHFFSLLRSAGRADAGRGEAFDHPRRQELVAGRSQVDAVGREDPFVGVGPVVLGEVGNAGLAEIDERGLHVGSHDARDAGVFIEHAVEGIGAGLLFTDHRRGAEHGLRPDAADLVNDRPEPLLELPFGVPPPFWLCQTSLIPM